MSENYWASDSINISQALYDRLDEIAQKRFGYTGQGILDYFVGEFEGLTSKEVLWRIAKDGYSISEDEIEFVN